MGNSNNCDIIQQPIPVISVIPRKRKRIKEIRVANHENLTEIRLIEAVGTLTVNCFFVPSLILSNVMSLSPKINEVSLLVRGLDI